MLKDDLESENDADLAMIIMRCAVNNCKFRCQYSELGGNVSMCPVLRFSLTV